MLRISLALFSLSFVISSTPALSQYNPYLVNPYAMDALREFSNPSPPTPQPNLTEYFIREMTRSSSSNSCEVGASYNPPNYNKCTQIGRTQNGVPIWSCC